MINNEAISKEATVQGPVIKHLLAKDTGPQRPLITSQIFLDVEAHPRKDKRRSLHRNIMREVIRVPGKVTSDGCRVFLGIFMGHPKSLSFSGTLDHQLFQKNPPSKGTTSTLIFRSFHLLLDLRALMVFLKLMMSAWKLWSSLYSLFPAFFLPDSLHRPKGR